MHLPPLYKTSNSGRVQVWSIRTEANRIITEHGFMDGKITTSENIVEQGTNIGRTNYRNEDEQADFEAKAKWEHKKKYSGYVEDLSEEQDSGLKRIGDGGISPMLATPFKRVLLNKIGFPLIVQPKLDGVRCTYSNGRLFGRSGNELLHFENLIATIRRVFYEYPDIMLDGELYLHGVPLRKISGIARKEHLDFDYATGTQDKTEKDTLQLWVFDCPTIYGSDDERLLPYSDRMKVVYDLLSAENITNIKVVPSFRVYNEDSMMLKYKSFVEDGFEGAMLKSLDMVYTTDKRVQTMLKLKDFKEQEFPILGVNEGKGPHKGMASTFTCISPEGKLFYPSMQGTHEWRKELLSNAELWKDKKVTVRYLQYWNGVPNCISALTKKGLKKNNIKYKIPEAVHIRPVGE